VHRLHQPPGQEARPEAGATARSPPPSRWTLRTSRRAVPELADYRLRGIWRARHRSRLPLRTARRHLDRPDPDDLPKVARRERCLRAAARAPEAVALVVSDAMGSSRWPDAAPDGMLAAPDAPPRWRGAPARPIARNASLAPALR
jgi:hypothetical protein